MKGNFWTESSAVRRYRDARPYFHPVVMKMIRRKLDLKGRQKLPSGLDVGCGTGQSTIALLDVVERAIGIDSSDEMLAHAERHKRVDYMPGSAEQMPVPDNSAEIVTASLAVHWFDLPAFLAESARVLRPCGWLVLYSNGFRGQMAGKAEFHDWCNEVYAVRYPSPPRQSYDPNKQTLSPSPFDWITSDPYENKVAFSQEQLVAYLMTQSNVVAAVEQGSEKAEGVTGWLNEQTNPFFDSEPGTFLFGGSVTYARLG